MLLPARRQAVDGLEIVALTRDRWDDVQALFERPGPRGGIPIPGNCWCMAWRDDQGHRLERKAAFKGCLDQGSLLGLLAYRDDTPVGWVAISPRADQTRLERSRQYGPMPGDQNVYAVTCFYVDRDLRGIGISSALLDAAIGFARDVGATALDAFPKLELPRHALESRRAEENESFMGRRASYEARGFVVVRETGKRAVMRLSFTK